MLSFKVQVAKVTEAEDSSATSFTHADLTKKMTEWWGNGQEKKTAYGDKTANVIGEVDLKWTTEFWQLF